MDLKYPAVSEDEILNKVKSPPFWFKEKPPYTHPWCRWPWYMPDPPKWYLLQFQRVITKNIGNPELWIIAYCM